MEDLRNKFDQAMTNVMNAREACLEAKEAEILAQEQLTNMETAILIMGNLKGKNKEERDADLRSRTTDERMTLLEAKKADRIAVLNLEIALDARRNLESILKIEDLERI